jgi:serine protease Do
MSALFRPGSAFRGSLILLLALGAAGTRASAQREAENLSAGFRKAAGLVAPSVVGIRALGGYSPVFPAGPGPIGPGGVLPGMPARPMDLRPPSGSGLIVDDAKGLVLTSEPVVEGALRVAVVFPDGHEVMTNRINRDVRTGLVLLTVDPGAANLPPVEWGESEKVQEGDWIVSVGRPPGRPRTLSAGIVSGIGPGARASGEFVTDALIAGENSGGPLVNLDGKVVGIGVARPEQPGRSAGFGRVIPASIARKVAGDLAEFGRVRRGYLGLALEHEGSADPRTWTARLIVTGVSPGGPAADAGLQMGDRLLAVDGQPLSDLETLSRAVEEAPVGQEFVLRIERGGATREIPVKSRQRPEPGELTFRPLQPGRPGVARHPVLRERARPDRSQPAGPRQPGVVRSEPGQIKAAQPPPSGNRAPEPKPKATKPERTPEAAVETPPDLPPALDPAQAPPTASEPRLDR